jgi:acetyl-CoA acyltransferase
MSGAVHIAGTGMTRFAKQPDLSLKQLVAAAVGDALADAGLAAADIQAAFFSNTVQGALEGQLMVRGQIALRPLGIEGVPVFNVENACASASSAFALAVNHIKAGAADIVLAVGADKMVVPDRAKMFGIFDGAWDVHDTEAGRERLLAMAGDVPTPEGVEELPQRSFFMDVYAAWAKAHMAAFGTTQAQIAAVAAKNQSNGALNPLAQYQRAMSVADVLAAQTVAWPLTLPMCAPISDGAAAAILVSERKCRELGLTRPVRVRAATVTTGVTRTPDQWDRHLTAIAAARAYDEAGVDPADISLAEVHDATAFGEIQQTENLKLAPLGGGGPAAERGETALGGRVPVNPSGGLEAKGHPIGATGLAQIHEMTLHLRGQAGARQVDNARLAIAENGGGLYLIEEATAAITILEGASA